MIFAYKRIAIGDSIVQNISENKNANNKVDVLYKIWLRMSPLTLPNSKYKVASTKHDTPKPHVKDETSTQNFRPITRIPVMIIKRYATSFGQDRVIRAPVGVWTGARQFHYMFPGYRNNIALIAESNVVAGNYNIRTKRGEYAEAYD